MSNKPTERRFCVKLTDGNTITIKAAYPPDVIQGTLFFHRSFDGAEPKEIAKFSKEDYTSWWEAGN